MNSSKDIKKKPPSNTLLGKRHKYEDDAPKDMRSTAIDLGFTTREINELSRFYKGKINNLK